MPLTVTDLERRRRLWAAMSDLFLDTETRWNVPFVGRACAESTLDDAALERVFWCEVFPLAIDNLHDIAGEWAMLELPEPALIERAERQERDRVRELTSAWMVTHTWTASLALCRRLRSEPPTRWLDLQSCWDVVGKRFLEDVARDLLSDPTKTLATVRAGGIDPIAEWQFYRPLLVELATDEERRELAARSHAVDQLLGS